MLPITVTRTGRPRRYAEAFALGCMRFADGRAWYTWAQTVNSLLTLQTNEQHLVTRHTEEWDHKRETSREDGFLGMLNEYRKRATAGVTGLFVSQEPPAGKTSK